MKRILVVLASLALVASLTACAKAPTEEINATKASVDAAVAEGAQQYTPEDYKMVTDGLAAANAEIKVQEEKFFKNFDKAKQMLAKTKADADRRQAGFSRIIPGDWEKGWARLVGLAPWQRCKRRSRQDSPVPLAMFAHRWYMRKRN
jgi:predicted small lipoprotein YifL